MGRTGGGGLLQRVSISPQVESHRRPRVIRFSGLAPAPRTSINSAARFYVTVKPILCCFCASASGAWRGWGLLRGWGWGAVASLDVVKTSTLAAGSRGALVGEGVAEVIP